MQKDLYKQYGFYTEEDFQNYDPDCFIGFKKDNELYVSLDEHTNFHGIVFGAITGYKTLSNNELRTFFNKLAFIDDPKAIDAFAITIGLIHSVKVDPMRLVTGEFVPNESEEVQCRKGKRLKLKKVVNALESNKWDYIFLFDLDKDILQVHSRRLRDKFNGIENSILVEINRQTNAINLFKGQLILREMEMLQK